MTIRARRGGWQVIVYAGLDPLTGRQKQVSRQVNGSKRDAEHEEARLITEVADGRHTGTRAKNFGELLDVWLPWRERNGKPISPRTVNDYRNLINDRIKPALGRKPIVKVTAPVLDVFYEELRAGGNAKAERLARSRARRAAEAEGLDTEELAAAVARAKPGEGDRKLSASRVHDVHVIISGALGLAVRRGWLPFNPAMAVRPASGKGTARKVPAPDQVKELFTALADDPELASFLRISVTTGLRPGEVCALRWIDLDLKQAVMDVNGNIITAKGLPDGYMRKDTKSVHGERLLSLDAGTVTALKAHRARCERLAKDLGFKVPADSYVFPRTIGSSKPTRPDAMTRRFTALAERLGHDYRLYGLRHFTATQLGAVAAAGTVRARMGHGSLSVTSGYMHQVSEADRKAAQFMGELLDGPEYKPRSRV
jgi:integrase